MAIRPQGAQQAGSRKRIGKCHVVMIERDAEFGAAAVKASARCEAG
jgi:hypothetical protein